MPRGAFISSPAAGRSKSGLDLRLSPAQRWLALVRNNGPFWQTPVYGKKWEDVPPETQMLLWQETGGGFGVVIPVVDGDWRSTVRGTAEGLIFDSSSGLSDQPEHSLRLAYLQRGRKPMALIREAMRTLADELKTFRLREAKPIPSFIDELGWCTWDAFYQEVSQAKVRLGLRSLRRAGIQPGFLILDDGWLDVTGDQLNDFATHPKKFPRGLASTVRSAKAEFGVKYFGVWHAFQGYWAGIEPKGKLAQRYDLLHTKGIIRWWDNKAIDLDWVHPKEVACFYHEFYRWLRQEGVDFTKTDGQSALEKFSGTTLGRVSTMALYQEALQGAAMVHFGTGPIHCMSNGSDVAFHLSASNLWRNSDDYFPKQTRDKQQWHVHMNAVNNIWTSTFAIPDWDMFQSHGPVPDFHAAARALSGGPVYICDKPGQHRSDIINKLVGSDRRVLRFSQPALPSEDSLFTDFREEARMLKITNVAAGCGTIGLFHCSPNVETITDVFRVSDVTGLPKGEYAVYFHQAKRVLRMRFSTKTEITLQPAEFEIATLSPVVQGWAIFGLIEKYASPVAILDWKVISAGQAIALLRSGGMAGFCVPSRPEQVRVNGRKAKFRFDPASNFLRVKTGPRGISEVEILTG